MRRASARPCWPRPSRRVSTASSRDCSSRPTCCPATSWARVSTCPIWGASSFVAGRSSRTFCWPTQSTPPPPTQSALLEAMNEGQVSVEGRTYVLEPPFFVLATQNPHEYEGTYPLPENQLDRFTICTDIGYPDRAHELQILEAHRAGEMVDRLQPALTGDQLKRLQTSAREVKVHSSINSYMLDIVAATRAHEELDLGVSTRGAIVLFRAVQCLAFLESRNFVIPDDVKRLALPVLAHRIVCRGLVREGQRDRSRAVIRQILQKTPVPA